MKWVNPLFTKYPNWSTSHLFKASSKAVWRWEKPFTQDRNSYNFNIEWSWKSCPINFSLKRKEGWHVQIWPYVWKRRMLTPSFPIPRLVLILYMLQVNPIHVWQRTTDCSYENSSSLSPRLNVMQFPSCYFTTSWSISFHCTACCARIVNLVF